VLMGASFKLRLPRLKRRLVQGLTGGIIAGFGARMAMGCNLAALFTGVPQFSFHAWIFTITTAVGAHLGSRVVQTRHWRGPLPRIRPSRVSAGGEGRGRSNRSQAKPSLQPVLGVIVALALVGVVIGCAVLGQGMLAAAAAFGGAFGLLIHRGQICFTAAFRDLWISGQATMSKAIAVAMIVSSVLTFIAIGTGRVAVIQVA